MLKIGLTGNIGSGKSLVSKVFSVLRVPVYHADEESRKFLKNPAIIAEITRRFGKRVLSFDGEIDRKTLASIVFNDKDELLELNALLHPMVREDFRTWFGAQESGAYVIHEAAIILESGFRKEFDQIIHVSCPQEIAIQRILLRENTTREEILSRMRFQWNDQKKAGLSDFVIKNDGSTMLLPHVLAVHRQLLVL